MLTHIVRHAATALSRQYLLNGDPRMTVELDAEGIEDCRRLAASNPWPAPVRTCVVSRFGRTMQTARLLLGPAGPPILVDPRLDEVSYGVFEARPWLEYGDWLDGHGRDVPPPGATEPLRDAQLRMLVALADSLAHPGPALVVAHGCLLALVSSIQQTGGVGGVILPGTAPLDVLSIPDDELAALVRRGVAQLDGTSPGPL